MRYKDLHIARQILNRWLIAALFAGFFATTARAQQQQQQLRRMSWIRPRAFQLGGWCRYFRGQSASANGRGRYAFSR